MEQTNENSFRSCWFPLGMLFTLMVVHLLLKHMLHTAQKGEAKHQLLPFIIYPFISKACLNPNVPGFPLTIVYLLFHTDSNLKVQLKISWNYLNRFNLPCPWICKTPWPEWGMQLTLNLLVVLGVLSSGLPEPPATQNRLVGTSCSIHCISLQSSHCKEAGVVKHHETSHLSTDFRDRKIST